MQSQNLPALRRVFGLRETVTITVGTVIGVGLFTVGASVVGVLGSAVLLATLAALLISVYPALLYGEMSGALPLSGGTYQYAKYGLCRPLGMLAGWNFIISMIAVASGEALAFSFYLRTLFEAIGLSLPLSDPLLACIAVLLFLLLGVFGVELSGKMQNAFLFFFWGVAVVWVLSMIPHLRFGNFDAPLFSGIGGGSFLSGVALIWWCFAGFETCCSLGEEIRHPGLNLPRALFLAPFIVFAVNGLFQWVLVCIVPPDALAALADAAAPYADGMRLAGVVGFPLVLLCVGIAFGGDFSTLNACICAPARYLQAMARDGAIPKFFAYVHPRFRTPVVAVIVPGLITAALVLTDSVTFIASLSLFATLFYYIIGICAACGLRRRFPGLSRPFRVKGIWLGAPFSVAVYLLLMTQLEWEAVLLGLGWSAIGLVLCFFCSGAKRRARDRLLREGAGAAVQSGVQTEGTPEPEALTDRQRRRAVRRLRSERRRAAQEAELLALQASLPPPPEDEERRKMDREFRFWKIVVFSACGVVLALNLLSFLL